MSEEDIEEIENRIYELEQLIRYEEEKQKVCGYGSTDLVFRRARNRIRRIIE